MSPAKLNCFPENAVLPQPYYRRPAIPALLDINPDSPPQALEPWRKQKPNCGNCPFSEQDKDDSKLYCHEGSAQGFPVVVMTQEKASAIAVPGHQAEGPKPKVLGVVGFFPEVNPEWSCWQHPDRQAERRGLSNSL